MSFGLGMSLVWRPAHIAQAKEQSCSLDENDIGNARAIFEQYLRQRTQSSGDNDFDNAFQITIDQIQKLYEISADYYFTASPKCKAQAVYISQYGMTDGSVFFGLDFLHQIWRARENPEVELAAVGAHEFAHIVQFKRGLQCRLDPEPLITTIHSELHADFLAGFYAGKKKLLRPDFPSATFALKMEKLGSDLQAWKSDFHGTKEQRSAAVVEGFNAAFRRRLELNEAAELGIMAVQKIAKMK